MLDGHSRTADRHAALTKAQAFAVLAGSILIWATIVFLARDYVVPIVSDETGYLSIADFIASGKIRDLSNTPVYNFGLAIFFTPVFWLAPTQSSAYVGAIAVCSLLTACIPIVLLAIARRLSVPIGWGVIVLSFAITLAPAYFFHNFIAWQETAFRLVFLLAVLSLISSFQTKRDWDWVSFAVAIAALYALHPRSALIVPLAVLVIGFACYAKQSSLRAASASFFVIVVAVILIGAGNEYFQVALWGEEKGEAGRAQEMLNAFTRPGGLTRFLIVVVGHTWVISATSAGLFGLGLFAAYNFRDRLDVLIPSAFAILCIGAIILPSAVLFIGFDRADHIIYERYTSGATTFLVWLGALHLIDKRGYPTPSPVLLSLGLIFFPGLIIMTWSFSLGHMTIVPPNISGLVWIDHLSPLMKTQLFTIVLYGSLAAVVLFALFYSLRGWPKAVVPILVAAVLFADYPTARMAEGAHNARRVYVERARKIYGRATEQIHWDRSNPNNGNTAIDQYEIGLMPASNIASRHIAVGAAALVSASFPEITGYVCVGKLPDGTKLLVRDSEASIAQSSRCRTPDFLAYSVGSAPLRFTVDRTNNLHTFGGWHLAEQWGTWTESEALIRIKLASQPGGALIASLDTRMMVGPNVPKRTLSIECNDKPCGEFVYTLDKPIQQLNLPLPSGLIGRDGRLDLRFLISPATTPMAAGVNQDGRSLGIGLTQLTIAAPETAQ